MTTTKLFSGHNRAIGHMNSQQLLSAQNQRKIKPDKNPNMEEGGEHQDSPLAVELLETDDCW